MSAARPPRFALGSATRVLAGLFIVALGMVGAVFTVAATGRRGLLTWLLATILLLAGFSGLAVTRAESTPLRPTRLALVISLVIAGFMILGLPWPPGRPELASFVTLTLGISLSLAALLVGSRSPRQTIGVLGLLGGYGIFLLARIAYTLGAGSRAGAWSHPGPAMSISLVLAASLAAAWIAACWHARPLWPALRQLRDRAT